MYKYSYSLYVLLLSCVLSNFIKRTLYCTEHKLQKIQTLLTRMNSENRHIANSGMQTKFHCDTYFYVHTSHQINGYKY